MFSFAVSRLEGAKSDGIHLVWSPIERWGYSHNGFTILRRTARRAVATDCEIWVGQELKRIQSEHVMEGRLAVVRFRQDHCPEVPAPLQSDLFDERDGLSIHEILDNRGEVERSDVMAVASEISTPFPTTTDLTTSSLCEVYRFDLREAQPVVRVRFASRAMLVMAFRDGKAILGHLETSSSTDVMAELRAEGIDRVDVYCAFTKRIELCVLDPESHQKLGDWEGSRVVAQLQLPIREVNPLVSTFDQELALVQARQLGSLPIAPDNFKEMAGVIRDLVTFPNGVPTERIFLRRDRPDQAFQQFNLLSLALLPQLDPDGRRMIGLGHRDEKDLVPGESYDYRIIGVIPEIDLFDVVLTFERVPAGTILPSRFSMGSAHFRLPSPGNVGQFPIPATGVLSARTRRGLELSSAAGTSLVIEFDEPVRELTLELEPDLQATLAFRAVTPGFLGNPVVAETGEVPAERFARLDFSAPIEQLELNGEALLYAVRLHGIIGPLRDPSRVIDVTSDIFGVRYEPTNPPAPPTDLAVTNLQSPSLPLDPEIAVKAPEHSLGFRLHWRTPVSGGTPVWPPNADLPPPMEVGGFALEKQRVDIPSVWKPLDVSSIYGNRYRTGEAEPLRPGVDLMEYFRDRGSDGGAHDKFVFDDVVRPPGQHDHPPPGSLWRYRIASIDVTGRHSAVWTESPVVRLEKRLPPPTPAPIDVPADGTEPIRPMGVHALVIERSDPDALVDDLARLPAGIENAILLRWSWPNEHRQQDPWAVHFRVYFQPEPADALAGTITGGVVDEGSNWRCQVDLNRNVAADSLMGLRIRSAGRSFRIISHGPGQANMTFFLAHSLVNPSAAPIPGDFMLHLDLAGGEVRPAAFAERIEVIDIQPGQREYEVVLLDVLAPSAHRPVHTGWVGVSTADDQSYIPDSIPASEVNGGKPGNESQILTRIVSARYRGRPTLTVPPPLAVIPERITDEPTGESVRVELPLPTLVRTPLGPSDIVGLERLALSEIIKRLRIEGPLDFRVRLLDESETLYLPDNSEDQLELEGQLRTGQPGQVAGRYVNDVLAKHPVLGGLFEPLGEPELFGTMTDELPTQADRYFYRIRRADAAGHLSQDAVLLDEIVRVPSLRKPGDPQVELVAPLDDRARVGVSVRPAFDLSWVLLFIEDEPLDDEPATDHFSAELIRVPNARELYPDNGIRLRTSSGAILSPHTETLASGIEEDNRMRIDFAVTIGHARRIRVWASSLTRDGIPSRPVGPKIGSTARALPEVPELLVVRSGTRAALSWVTPSDLGGREQRVERRIDTGPWERATGWLGSAVTSADLRIPDEPIAFRLVIRHVGGQQAVGEAVLLPEV